MAKRGLKIPMPGDKAKPKSSVKGVKLDFENKSPAKINRVKQGLQAAASKRLTAASNGGDSGSGARAQVPSSS